MKEICDALERGGVDALRALLDAQPSLVQTTDRLGDLPLHVACSYRFETIEALHSLPVLELFVERYPQALQTRNGHGMLPLHLSCWFGSEAQIRAIAAWYPGGLAEVDDNGYQPITFVIAKLVMEGRPWEEYQDLLTFLLGMCPESLWNMDHQGVLALQSACFDNDGSDAQPIPTGRQLLELYCRLTNTPHQQGGLHRIVDVPNQRVPLHVAIASQTRLEVAQMIYQADPTAIRLTDRQGRLPLHHVMSQPFASRQMRSLREKLTWLLQVDPSAVAHYDHDGKTPLHLLLENESLVVRPNEGVATNNNHNQTRSTTTTHDSILSSSLLVPGDDLLYSPDSTALLKLLLTPRNATSQRDRNEWVLFAVRAVLNACNNHNNNTTPITNPCALPDLQHGNLPLHLAVQFHRHERSAPGLVEGLLQHFPGAILHANHKGQTALQLVLASSRSSPSSNATSATASNNNNNPCCSLDTIFTLVNNNPTSVL